MRAVLILVACLCPVPGFAQGWIEPFPRPQPAGQQVERVRTSVLVRVEGRVARVEVEEWFRNTGRGLAEGDYHFPLPGEAVFSNLSLFQGEEELKGELMDAARARAIYEEIVRTHRDPALVELAGHGLVRARVFPFQPGETRRVVLRYTQVLARAGDSLQFRFLAGSSPSSSAPAGAGCRPPMPCPPGPAPRATPAPDAQAPVSLTVAADEGRDFGEPFSPTHTLRVSRERDRLVVRPVEDVRGSFDLFLPLAGPEVGITLATHRVEGEDGYFMLTLSPGRVPASREPRDIAVAVDVSGSMAGEKMEQARQALHRLLASLEAGDRFRLIAFSTRVEAFRPGWSPVTREARDAAAQWVDRLAASGGTHIAGALDELFREPAGADRLHLAVFVTDGLPTVGETNPDRIAANVEARHGEARIFVFGVGYDLDPYLLERLAVAGRGTVDYVRPDEDVEAAVGALVTRLRHPVLVDLRFGGAPARITQLQPARLPDLYAGQDLVVFGRYATSSAARGEIALVGRRAGQDVRFASTVEFPLHAAGNAYIPALWAARRLGELMQTMQIEGATPERMAEARELALRYGLLSAYTSYLVQEPPVILRMGGASRAADSLPFAGVTAVRLAPGEAAVEAASAAGARRRVETMADLVALERGRPAVVVAHDERVVAARRFRASDTGWIDTNHAPAARIVEIEPFGRAGMAVLTRLPELRQVAGAFETVTVAGARVSIRFAPGGRATLAEAELQRLVSDFRGW